MCFNVITAQKINLKTLFLQICLRWLYEQGLTFVAKSYDKERMNQNLQIFDWSLTEDDYKKISEIHQDRLIKGPTKPLLNDLWDEE